MEGKDEFLTTVRKSGNSLRLFLESNDLIERNGLHNGFGRIFSDCRIAMEEGLALVGNLTKDRW
jgi:hypothetical protein